MFVILFSAIVGLCYADLISQRSEIIFDCNANNGVVWWGCGSFGVCQNGQYSQIDCNNGTVYNRQVQDCTPAGGAPYPCGNPPPDCRLYVESPGHRIPNTQPDTFEQRPPCSYYYTCSYGRFLGFQACPNEQVYDEGEQRCNLPLAVPPPCGFGPERDEDPRQGQGQQGQGQGQQGQGQIRNPTQQGQTTGNQNTNRNPTQQGQTTRNPNQNQFGNTNSNSPFAGNQNTGTQNTNRNPTQQGQNQGTQGQPGTWSSQGQPTNQGQPGTWSSQGQPTNQGQPGTWSSQGQPGTNQGQSGTWSSQGQTGTKQGQSYGNQGPSYGTQSGTYSSQGETHGQTPTQGQTYGSYGQGQGQGQTYGSYGQGQAGTQGNTNTGGDDPTFYRYHQYRYRY